MARPGNHGVEHPLPAEEDILHALDGLDINGAGLVHHGQVPGIHDQLLARGQVVLHGGAVNLQERDSPAGELLHNEALAAEEARPQLLLEEHGQLHPLLRSQEGGLLAHNGLPRPDLHRPDVPGEAGRKSDHARPALGGVEVLEHSFPGEHPAEGLAQAAPGGGLHLHIGAHPHHGALLRNHGLSGVQIADHHRHGLALDLIVHRDTLLFISVSLPRDLLHLTIANSLSPRKGRNQKGHFLPFPSA